MLYRRDFLSDMCAIAGFYCTRVAFCRFTLTQEARTEFFIKKTLLERTCRIKTMVSSKLDDDKSVKGQDELDEYQYIHHRWPQPLVRFLKNLDLLKRRCFFCGEEHHPVIIMLLQLLLLLLLLLLPLLL